MASTTATNVAAFFLDHYVVSYGIRDYQLTVNSPQVLRKIFATLYRFLGVKHMKITAYHPETHGQVERYTKSTVATYGIM